MKDSEESVDQLMSTPILSIGPQTRVDEVFRLSDELAIHHFPLVEDGVLVGIVCTCDLESANAAEAVSRFAHRLAVVVAPKSTAREAAAKMKEHRVGSVLVADDEGVWGIITREDLAETVPELVEDVLCLACGARRHLRHLPGGRYVCTACAAP